MTAYVQTYSRLYLCALNQEAHDRTCDYWYTVSSHAMAHTAFTRRAALLRWLNERGLSVAGDIPEPGQFASFEIKGAYRTARHLDRAAFDALKGEQTRALSNGEYTLAVITLDPDGLRTVHTLNPNVRDRPVFDYRESRELYC